MVYAAKRGKSRCPTHPGAQLRCDIIPATGRTKAEIAGCSEFRASIFTTSCRKESRCHRLLRFGSASFLATARESGLGCRPPSIPGMRNAPKMSAISRPSRPRPLETKPFEIWHPISRDYQDLTTGGQIGMARRPRSPLPVVNTYPQRCLRFHRWQNRATRRACRSGQPHDRPAAPRDPCIIVRFG